MSREYISFSKMKEILEPIPEDKFITGAFGHPFATVADPGTSCSVGHIHRHYYPGWRGYVPDGQEVGLGVYETVNQFLVRCKGIEPYDNNVFIINDYKSDLYPQETPKERIMALIEEGIVWENSINNQNQ